MTHDFAKKKRAPAASKRKKSPRPNSQVPGWVWLFTGTALGAFIAFLVYLAGLAPEKQSLQQKASPEKRAEKNHNKPQFDFYTLLPDSSVEVPDEQATLNTVTPDYDYILQTGSFRNTSDADRQRAQLLLMNMNARIESASPKGKSDVWHRVLVGPFESRSKMASARQSLISNGINPLVLKKKRPDTQNP
ncbi:MAG: SPOR domain-containing protein [Cellvibrionaceae bacterium]